MSVTPKSFDAGGAISRQFHLNAGSYFRMAEIAHPDKLQPLVAAPSPSIAALKVHYKKSKSRFEDYVQQDDLLDSVIVLHKNKILYEAYPNMQARQRHFAWSVTKVFTSTLLAKLAQDGLLDMQKNIGHYVAELRDTVWGDLAIQQVADMASGVDCLDDDGYQKSSTCIYTMEESLGITAPTSRKLDFIKVLQGMKTVRPANTKTEYVSANTNVLMLVIEAVSGESFSKLAQQFIWEPIGAEADALMVVNKQGYAYASGGLHARLRDLARFGQIYSQWQSVDILTGATVKQIQSSGLTFPAKRQQKLRKTFGKDIPLRSGWQWDYIWADGAMFKGGYLGQGIYVDPAKELVIAWFGTGLDYDKVKNQMLPISRQIARAAMFKQ